MGINFRKRVKLGKYANVNLGKTGAGFSFGIPGARISINSKGKTQASLGIPGTGLSYTKVLGTKMFKKNAQKANHNQAISDDETLEAYNQALYALVNIHNEVGSFVDFNAPVLSYYSNEIGPLQIAAAKELEDYQPSFFDNLLKKDRSEELKAKLIEAINEDEKNRPLININPQLQAEILKKKPNALQTFLNQVGAFKKFEDDCESYSLNFDLNVDEVEGLLINVTTDIVEDVLDEEFVQNKKSISTKKLSNSAFNERSYAYIASLVVGFIKEAFAYLPLDIIHINVIDQSRNPNTGLTVTKTIVAGEFSRDIFNSNFSNNPIELFEKGLIDVSFGVRKGFEPVEPIELD